MADNGHCNTCQSYNSAWGCSSKQNFCSVRSQTVSGNETDLKIESLMPTASSGTQVYNSVLTSVKSILQYIHDFGVTNAGTEVDWNCFQSTKYTEDGRTPTQSNINNIPSKQGQQIALSDYNKMLTALSKAVLTGHPSIAIGQLNNIKSYIRNLSIDPSRCNICNTSGCQTTQCGGCSWECSPPDAGCTVH